nr:hypothetical protein [Thermoanaerobacter wiegelii]
MRVDSHGEYEFARSLDEDPDVLLFTKLKKGGLVIETPYGNYTPDWAIIHKVDDHKAKLYFIVESKFEKERINLTDVEKAKIECARKHFATVSSDVVFDWVNSYERFKDIVNRSIQKNNVGKRS